MKPQPSPVEVLNNINGDLVTLYRVVQNHLEEFVRQFKWALSSRQVFEWQKMIRPETLTDIQRAADFSTFSTMPSPARSPVRRSARRLPPLPSTCCASRKTSRPRGSACSAPTSKTSPGLNALNATTVPIPSITWIRLTDRPPVMESTSLTRITNGWPTSCVAAKAK
jgi:hypothetical protein